MTSLTSRPMIILLRHGLANRLRTIVGFTYVARMLNIPITFYWGMNDAECNGLFSDLFEPYLTTIHECNPVEHNVIPTFIGQATIQDILKMFSITTDVSMIEKEYYLQFRVKPHILEAVETFFTNNDGRCAKGSKQYYNFAAMHIRRTDHIDLAKRFDSYTDDDEFDTFASKCRHDGKYVFLATDSHDVQKKYKWCKTYKNIIPSNKLRQTTLADALIDALIASKCVRFKGSGFSSYSRLIEIFSQ